MKAVFTTLFITFMLLGTSDSSAQTRIITLDEAIDLALENNLNIKAASLNKEAAQKLEQSSFELPKTNVSFQYGNNEGFEYNDGIQISQSIPFPTLFGAKKQLFEAQTQGKEWDKQNSVNELKSQVRSYYYQLRFLENNAEKLRYLDGLYEDFVKIASLRYKTGDTRKIDINTAETQRGEITLLYQQNEIYIQNAYKNLKTLLQIKEDFNIQKETFSPMFLSSVINSDAVANHPKINALLQQAKIAEQSKKVEKAQALPDISLGYNNVSLIGMHTKNNIDSYYGRSQRFSFFDVGITIPITFGATKSRIRSLEAQKQAAELSAEMQQQQLITDFENSMQQYEQNVRQYNYYYKQALPNSEEMITISQLGYKTGEISYVEYLYALNMATNVQLKYLEAIQKINQSVIDINSLINK